MWRLMSSDGGGGGWEWSIAAACGRGSGGALVGLRQGNRVGGHRECAGMPNQAQSNFLVIE